MRLTRGIPVVASLVVLVGCAPLASSAEPSFRFDGERDHSIIFRGSEYVTRLSGVLIDEPELIPIGQATLVNTSVVDPSVWALPGIDPAKLIVLRTPPGFEEPSMVITDFIYFQAKGIAGTIPEACPFYADPTPGCPNMYPSPSPT